MLQRLRSIEEQQQLDTAMERMARFREEIRTTGPAPTVTGAVVGPVESIQPVGVTKDSRMSARYGLRGVRVGEAKNPGPRRRLRRVSNEESDPGPASVGAAIHHDMTLVDSADDDAPFVLPGRRGSVHGARFRRF